MKFPEIYHIGIHKTGTTTLQNVLAADERINLILYSRFFNTNKWFGSEYNHYQEGKNNIESDENMVISLSGLSGIFSTLSRIHRVSPNAKIIVTIREQRSLLISMYKHHIRQTHNAYSPDNYLNSNDGIAFLNTLFFADLYKQILIFFPKENVHFFLLEEMREDFTGFIRSFYQKIFGLEPPAEVKSNTDNIGLNDTQIAWKRRFNNFYLFKESSTLNKLEHQLHNLPLKLIFRITRNASKKRILFDNFKNADKLSADFRKTNAELSALTGLPLEKYGYLV